MAGLKQSDRDLAEAEARLPLFRFFVQDFGRLDDEMDESAARERVRTLDHVPAFLLGVHLICAAAMLLAYGNPLQAPPGLLATLAALLALDAGLWGWLYRRPLSRLAPHVAIRGGALYALVADALWCGAALAAAPVARGDLTVLDIAVAGGVLAIPVAFLSFPALAALGCLGYAIKLYFISHDPLSAGAALLLST
ncbi:MAG TPA: hypothetical protein VES64_07485, partial [Allosphingosinicella sp.]|nr:hypothetical protein [Allosphingosinicella sp.]